MTDFPPFPAAPSPRTQGEAGREGKRVGGFADVSWRPRRGAPLSPGRSGLPGPRSGCCEAQDLPMVLTRTLQLGLGLCFLNGAEAVTRASSADPPAPPEWPAHRASHPDLVEGGSCVCSPGARSEQGWQRVPRREDAGCLESPIPSSGRGPRTHPDPISRRQRVAACEQQPLGCEELPVRF